MFNHVLIYDIHFEIIFLVLISVNLSQGYITDSEREIIQQLGAM